MEYTKGLLSVVIPTFKRSDMLARAIESVLNQTYKRVECIVVNDNIPGDEYSQLLYALVMNYNKDSRFVFVEQEKHINGAAARNAGIRVAKGEYIAFLDDDDFWDLCKAEIQIHALEKLPKEWGAVSCLMRFFKKGKLYSANYPYKSGYIHYEVLTRCISMGTGSLIIRRNALDETGYFDESLFRFQDPQLFSCLTEKYKVKLIKRYLHNRDVDDAQNRPTINNIENLQMAFFKSVQNQLNKLSKKDVKQLYIIYDFDKFKTYWINGKKKQALKMLFGVFRYPSTTYFAIRRVLEHYLEKQFLDYRINRYR